MKYLLYKDYEDRGEGWQYYYNPDPDCNKNNYNGECFERVNDPEVKRHVDAGHSVFVEIPVTTWGDYSGDTVTRSNFEGLRHQYKDDSRFYFLSYAFNGHCAIVTAESMKDEDIADMFKALEDYPLLYDDRYSELELKLESESWDSWVKFDLERALKDAGIDFDPDTLESDYYYVRSYNNIDGYCEDAVSWHISMDEVVKHWGFHVCPSCNKRMDYKGQICSDNMFATLEDMRF